MSIDPNGGPQRIHLLTITVSVLVVYIWALYADYLPIDDGGILQSVQSGTFSFSDLFLRGGKEYYRPLAILSFKGDFYLFGGKIAGYHLVNVLLHLCNALLVYRLTLLYLQEEKAAPFYSFIAGLLFALHPINSEAVVWIACRPDLLCCFFSLLCLLTALRIEKSSGLPVFAALFLFCLCSLLSKEASLFLPPAIAVYFFLQRKIIGQRQAFAAAAAVGFSAIIYLLMRSGLSHFSKPTLIVPLDAVGVSNLNVFDGVAAFGFYIRKFLYPFPLNFTITDINSRLYASLFFVFTAVAVFLWKKEFTIRAPLTFLTVSLIPPIGAMLMVPIWVPYAERYLYLPSVAFSLCTVIQLLRFGKNIPRHFVTVCVLALALPTAFRVRLWTEPIPFWQDSVAKAPNFATARLVLSSEYLKAGQYKIADDTLRQAVLLGLPTKTRKSFLEIRKQLDEKLGALPDKPLKEGHSKLTPTTPLVR